jgi:hypothetical protein
VIEVENNAPVANTSASPTAKKTPFVQPDLKAMSRTDRKRHIWRAAKVIKLTDQQKRDMGVLYASRDVRDVVNPYSLSATLSLYPSLRDAYVPDWTYDQQLSFETVSNKPVLYTLATKEIDPWQS